MNRERIADDIYIFTSPRYAQVTAGAILTKAGVVLIDTLFFPEETKAMKQFLENRLNQRVRYIINTHYHADHTLGNYQFPHAQVFGHRLCREMLDSVGRRGLEQTKSQLPEFADVELVLPEMIFDEGEVSIHIGGKTLRLRHVPGHSLDMINVLVENDNVMFASDNMMPVPTLFDGDYDDLLASFDFIREMKPETVVQGHGEIILRGEVNHIIQSHIDYLQLISQRVQEVYLSGQPASVLESIDIESCGKSRIPLNGFVSELHQANLQRLYGDLVAAESAKSVETG
ncbi:MAG: MBL fold metallo-hydrolase [Anaerolineales bacterium]|nr:MBL fold metallo-hydrolase [Anaerolineales bacterium]MCB0007319.1 MBL fold metallo-hydrolase [Anaerolineales bacterium]MCB0011249.1 MBL fold metallo-hydrolase [Anaerolineales bacterium]MCB0018750.1 MBL fold metallo-hydrolase [Anaerolineales bacterium]MCB8962099.1 MBL fold metallo-hydrolase [Ardenticatenales bacterium]